MGEPFATAKIDEGLYRIVDVLGNHAYLVLGETSALLVDTCGGFGDIRACLEALSDLPVTVVLTHGHEDHLMGAYWYEEAYLSTLDGGNRCWESAEERSSRIFQQVVEEGLVDEGEPLSLRDGSRPREVAVHDGDSFDLGGRTVRAYELPGHTAGSIGYLVEDLRVLLLGDAITPIMCLFFEESSTIAGWRATLERMQSMPFDVFYTGHHDPAFGIETLPSFIAAADYAVTDRGMGWEHNRLHEFRGIIHLCPCDTFDADSVDFRAVIEPWHELAPRTRKRRHKTQG